MSKNLPNQIEKKLDKLSKLLDQIQEAQILQPTEPETWDSDMLYNLTAQLKEALQLLEDQKVNRRNEFGEPIVYLEAGLGSLMNQYHEDQEEDDD